MNRKVVMSDRNRIDINKKKIDKKYNIKDEEKQMKQKATKQFKHRKLELYDEDSLEELENYQ